MSRKIAAAREFKRMESENPGPDIEIVPQGLTPGELPDGIEAAIDQAIDDYCARYGVEDMKKASSMEWGACCIYIGKHVFKAHDILKDPHAPGQPIDVERACAVVDLWEHYCLRFDKPPLVWQFCAFADVSDQWIMGLENGVISRGAPVGQKVKRVQERGLATFIVDGKKSPVGAFGLLNHFHGWTQPLPQQRESVKPALSASEIAEKYRITDKNS